MDYIQGNPVDQADVLLSQSDPGLGNCSDLGRLEKDGINAKKSNFHRYGNSHMVNNNEIILGPQHGASEDSPPTAESIEQPA